MGLAESEQQAWERTPRTASGERQAFFDGYMIGRSEPYQVITTVLEIQLLRPGSLIIDSGSPDGVHLFKQKPDVWWGINFQIAFSDTDIVLPAILLYRFTDNYPKYGLTPSF
jgi:hypothetical protein